MQGETRCLQLKQTCDPAFRGDYLLAGLDCVRSHGKRRLARASDATLRGGGLIALPASGRPTFSQALQLFDKVVAHLPGVKQRRGVVGKTTSGTIAVEWLELYKKRLSPAQRAVLRKVVTPSGKAVTIEIPAPQPAHKTASAPTARASALTLNQFAAITREAVARLEGHGLAFKHPISVRFASKGPQGTFAISSPGWLEGTSKACDLTVYPLGRNGPLVDVRSTAAHELIHCAESDMVASNAERIATPKWIREGTATWGGDQVSLEWSGVAHDAENAWPFWLKPTDGFSNLDLFKRDYDAVGLYALLKHQGVDPWALFKPLVQAGATRGSAGAFQEITTRSPSDVFDLWGPTLLARPALGPQWDLNGPAMPHPQPESFTIGNGTSRAVSIEARAGLGTGLNIQADIVHVAAPDGLGLFRGPDGADHPLGDDLYCARPQGCQCPDGSDPGFPKIGRGTGYVGVASPRKVSYLQLGGQSLDSFCKDEQNRSLGNGIVVGQAGKKGTILPVARFASGHCSAGRAGFAANAKDRGFSLVVAMETFTGFDKVYDLRYGPVKEGSIVGFVVHGIGGPFSNTYTPPQFTPIGGNIQFADGGRTMILGFLNTFNPSLSQARIIFGRMKCKYPKGQGPNR